MLTKLGLQSVTLWNTISSPKNQKSCSQHARTHIKQKDSRHLKVVHRLVEQRKRQCFKCGMNYLQQQIYENSSWRKTPTRKRTQLADMENPKPPQYSSRKISRQTTATVDKSKQWTDNLSARTWTMKAQRKTWRPASLAAMAKWNLYHSSQPGFCIVHQLV